MDMKPIKDIENQAEARQIAIDWQAWVSEQNMFYSELLEWHDYFETIADVFDLRDEFIEEWII